uniref:ShKT domain-containing protein n=1 Tax=Plectus sambesii TaxID=2011161 RepID=A0A914WJZ6_9BILA
MLDTLPQLLQASGLTYKVTINDVQKLIVDHEHQPVDSAKNVTKLGLGSFSRRFKDDDGIATGRRAYYNFSDYGSYEQMVQYMDRVAFFNPAIAQMVKLGTTHEGRVIQGVKIGNPASETNKRVVWIDGGIHSREWASMHTALFFINELVSKYGVDGEITHYVDSLNFYIFPCLNPDGYEFSRSSAEPEIRLWRKNRSPEKCTVNRWQQSSCCKGVDLNRNFDFHWSESGSSADPCSSIFQGTEAFSEPESKAVRDLIFSPELDGKTDAFITMHTYAQIWIHPFSHQPSTYPYDLNDLQQVGKKAIANLESLYGTKYRLGTGADTLSPASGGSDDWAKDKAKIKYVYLLELRPEENRWNGFILKKRELIPTAKETWFGVKTVIDQVLENRGLTRAPTQAPTIITETVATTTVADETARFVTEACKDLRYSCSKWLARGRGLCTASESFMREQCAKSCGFCT